MDRRLREHIERTKARSAPVRFDSGHYRQTVELLRQPHGSAALCGYDRERAADDLERLVRVVEEVVLWMNETASTTS